MNQADALGSASSQRTFKVGTILCLLRGHGMCPGGLGAGNPHAGLHLDSSTQSGLGRVTLHPSLWFLHLQNGVHDLLPQAVLSGNPPCPSPGAVVSWCFLRPWLSASVD